MKRQLLPAVALGLVLLLPTPAFACTPIPAKTWKGSIQVASPSTMSATNTTFSNNRCTFPNPAVNGVDAVVFDVASHRGLAGKATWTTTAPAKPDKLFAYYRNSSCVFVPSGQWTHETSGKALSFTIPKDAKWLIVQPLTLTPSKDIAVTISSPGRKCR